MENAIRFNRHEIFTATQMKQTSTVIDDVTLSDHPRTWELVNMLSGLYDGYLYKDILLVSMEFSQEIYETVLDLYVFIDNNIN